jgi:hypothetical protein
LLAAPLTSVKKIKKNGMHLVEEEQQNFDLYITIVTGYIKMTCKYSPSLPQKYFLLIRTQRKQHFYHSQSHLFLVPETFFIHVSKGDETVGCINIDKQNFCGVQRWHFTKKNSGWGKKTVEKTYIAILLKNATYVFQQMNKDSDGRVDYLVELEDIIKEYLGISKFSIDSNIASQA